MSIAMQQTLLSFMSTKIFQKCYFMKNVVTWFWNTSQDYADIT